MRGKTVFVRACGDKLLKRIVWEVVGDVFQIVNEDGFKRLKSGDRSFIPPGFRAGNVFEFDPTVNAVKFKDWNLLTPVSVEGSRKA
jgi:hypothetical protein